MINLFRKAHKPKEGLTAKQFYFPYFFDERHFRNQISIFDLTTNIKFNKKLKIAFELELKSRKETKLTIKIGERLMIEKENLIIWSIIENTLQIKMFDLKFIEPPKSLEMQIAKLEIGHNSIEKNLNLNNFITYIQSEKIKYNQEYYEKYAILIITDNTAELIPFDWFNKKGGDYGYVWPALAQIDNDKILYGSGMRMDNFKINLNNK